MAAFKLLNLLAVTTLALLAGSFTATPVTALSAESGHAVRHFHAHDAVIKKKRQSRRCKPRPSAPAPAAPADTQPAQQPPPATGGSDNTPAPAQPAPAPNTGGGAAPPTGGASTGGGKAGLAWPINDDNALRNMKGPKIGPIYTWSPWIPEAARGLGLEGVPMLWGDKQIDEFSRLVKPGYARYALGFNEPNEPSQSNMSPQHAADVWRQFIDPLKYSGYKLISPACTNAPSGKQWMADFLAACQGCQVDAIAIHYYDTSAQGLIDYATDMHNTFGRNIWVTEFACQNFGGGAQCSREQVFSFMDTVTNFMDNTPWVDHYFAFGAMYDMYNVNPANQLLGGNGQPTDLGWMYIS